MKFFTQTFSCRDAASLLSTHIDNELDEKRAKQLQTHLDACDLCRTKLQQLRREQETVQAALRSLPHISPSPDFDLRVLASLELQPKQSALLDFCDKLDAIFARPFNKILASGFAGLSCVLIFSALTIHAMGVSSPESKPTFVQSPPETNSYLAMQSEIRKMALMNDLELQPSSSKKQPQKSRRQSWNEYPIVPRAFFS